MTKYNRVRCQITSKKVSVTKARLLCGRSDCSSVRCRTPSANSRLDSQRCSAFKQQMRGLLAAIDNAHKMFFPLPLARMLKVKVPYNLTGATGFGGTALERR